MNNDKSLEHNTKMKTTAMNQPYKYTVQLNKYR